MIKTARRLMCDKFSVLCTLAELNAKQEREDERMKVNLKIKRLNDAAVIPQYAHEYDAGVDLVATEDVIVEPGATVKVLTGIAISLPPNFEAQVRPRSGITLKTKLRVALGTIDAGYVGEIGVIVDNISRDNWSNAARLIDNTYAEETRNKCVSGSYLIRRGDRIAQLVVNQVERAHFQEVAQLSETTRGTGGFGSSGVKYEQLSLDLDMESE